MHQTLCLHDSVYPGLEGRLQDQMSMQSGSGASQIQEKLQVPFSLTFACPLLVRHYTQRLFTIEEIAAKMQ